MFYLFAGVCARLLLTGVTGVVEWQNAPEKNMLMCYLGYTSVASVFAPRKQKSHSTGTKLPFGDNF